jgi:hypothetical protein
MFAKVCAAVVVLVTLVACGAGEPSPSPTTTSPGPLGPAVPATSSVPAGLLDLPFDDYQLNFAEESEIRRARTVLARACLRERGVRFDVPDDVRTPGAMDVEPNLRRYGVVDEGSAAGYGYHVPTTAEEKRQQEARQRWAASITEDQRMALFGEGGCTEEADAKLTTFDDGFLGAADQESLRTSERDPRVVATVAAWHTCMTGQGYAYPNPDAAIDDPRWDIDAAAIPKAEIDTALADVRCKTSSGLVETWHDVEVGVQQDKIRRDAGRFAALASARDKRLAAARRVLAG